MQITLEYYIFVDQFLFIENGSPQWLSFVRVLPTTENIRPPRKRKPKVLSLERGWQPPFLQPIPLPVK